MWHIVSFSKIAQNTQVTFFYRDAPEDKYMVEENEQILHSDSWHFDNRKNKDIKLSTIYRQTNSKHTLFIIWTYWFGLMEYQLSLFI